jgi:hypothetical protein
MIVYIMLLCLWMHICIYVVVRFEFEFKSYMHICIHVVVSFECILFNFLTRKYTIGAVLD